MSPWLVIQTNDFLLTPEETTILRSSCLLADVVTRFSSGYESINAFRIGIAEFLKWKCYSFLSTTSGSTCVARSAGTQQASSASKARRNETPRNVGTSVGFMP